MRLCPPCSALVLVASLSCAATMHGCGAQQTQIAHGEYLEEEDARAFDHGVDFIGTVSGLDGEWRGAWDRDLKHRALTSDSIVILTIGTVRTDSDPEQRLTHRLVGRVERTLHGAKMRGELEVWVRQGLSGFRSVNDNLARLDGQKFVAFLRWYRTDTGEDAAHWHMSPATDEVVLETKRVLSANASK